MTLKQKKLLKKAYYVLREAFLAIHPVCQACRRVPSRDVHHVRGRLGWLLVESHYWMAVCRGCHNRIHDDIPRARSLGQICEKGRWGKLG